jgi:hypothetical protein
VDFIFQGFQSSLPVWAYLLIFAGTVFLAWWSYSSVTGIRKSFRYILIALRSAVFFILLLLLLNPFLKTESPYFEQSKILVMLDNSESTAIEKSVYKGLESYRIVLDELNFGDSSFVDFDLFSFGNQTAPTDLNQLTFDADQTNLSEAIRTIRGNQSDANAAILISDGIFTKGQNPVFEAENIGIPVFAIGLGDTTFQQDLLVSSVTTNSTGYLNAEQPVTATISSKGFAGQPFQVQLKKGDEVISSQTVTPNIENSTQDITFDLSLDEKGLQQYQIEIPELADEWTGANNSHLFSVDVLDARQQILSLAFEVHPDVRFLRNLLLQDQNTNLTSRTWLSGNRFIEGPLSIDTDTVDLAIIHGYPRSGLPGGLQQTLVEMAEQVPLIVVSTPMFNPQRFEQEITELPVSVVGPWEYVPVFINPDVEPTEHPVMELPTITYDRIPPVYAPIRNLDNIPGSTLLFNSTYQGRATQKPVLTVQELGNKRMSLFPGFGWFRLNQSSNPQVREFIQQLWLNTVSWTATDPENQKLNVQPAQKSFTGSEPVVINAYLTNERGEVESEATIDISVESDSMDSRFYSMENRGAGQYQLNLGTMPEGIYSFEATAQKGNRTIESQGGEFAVARSNAEFLTTTRNDQLLRQVAERSGGSYVPFDSVSGFWIRLNDRGLLDQSREIETTFFYPYQNITWFILVLVLLAVEWIFRKYLSLP